MHDLFISYARSDSEWIEEELLPALHEIEVSSFLDDAEWRRRREAIDGEGLLPGDDLEDALGAALQGSRAVALFLSPAYFASKNCRWELDRAETLARENAHAESRLKLIYFILARHDKRLDLSPAGERVLYVDLTDVRERAAKLAYGLQILSPKARTLAPKLGPRSLQDLLEEPQVRKQVESLRLRHQEFRDAHSEMQAFKEVHDGIQRAQDSWLALAKARDEVTTGADTPTMEMAADLMDRCGDIRAAFDAPALPGDWSVWCGILDSGIEQLLKYLFEKASLEVLNQALEDTRSLLFLSTVPAELNAKIRIAAEKLPIERLREALAPLRALEKCPWQAVPLEKLTRLTSEFDALEKLLADIKDLVEVHDVLQHIDSFFSVAVNVEAKLVNIERIWPGIEAQRQKIKPRLAAAAWLRPFGEAVESMNRSLHQDPKPEVLPRAQIERFMAQLNQSFSRVDIDLRNETSRLQKGHDKIDALLGQLSGVP